MPLRSVKEQIAEKFCEDIFYTVLYQMQGFSITCQQQKFELLNNLLVKCQCFSHTLFTKQVTIAAFMIDALENPINVHFTLSFLQMPASRNCVCS